MITLKDFMEAIQYRITEGSEYLWNCYGPNARSLDHWNGKTGSAGRTASIVFDTETQFVYQMEAWDQSTNVSYRWIHPGYIEGVAAEAKDRGVDFYQSFDDNKFTDLEVAEDILEKAAAMVAGVEYDKRIMITLNLSYDEEHTLMAQAHAADMTVNDYVAMILQQVIDEVRLG